MPADFAFEYEPFTTRLRIPLFEKSLRLRGQVDCPWFAALRRLLAEGRRVRARDDDFLIEQVHIVPAERGELAEPHPRRQRDAAEVRDRGSLGELGPQPGEFVVHEVARPLLPRLGSRARCEQSDRVFRDQTLALRSLQARGQMPKVFCERGWRDLARRLARGVDALHVFEKRSYVRGSHLAQRLPADHLFRVLERGAVGPTGRLFPAQSVKPSIRPFGERHVLRRHVRRLVDLDLDRAELTLCLLPVVADRLANQATADPRDDVVHRSRLARTTPTGGGGGERRPAPRKSASSGVARLNRCRFGPFRWDERGEVYVISYTQDPFLWQVAASERLICRLFPMGRAGIEPATLGLKVPCSTN